MTEPTVTAAYPHGGTVLAVEGLAKTFTLHLQAGAQLDVLSEAAFTVAAGECVVLSGPSGAGKSSILKIVGGTYRPNGGAIRLTLGGRTVDLAALSPRALSAVRREAIGHVTQFLRVIPRVSTLEVVAEPLTDAGVPWAAAMARAAGLLSRLGVPERLHALPPSTFSGGEKQRVNIARGFALTRPLLLLDEPTAALDAENRAAVVALVEEARAAGVAILGVFHDREVTATVATRTVDVAAFGPARSGGGGGEPGPGGAEAPA